MPDALANLTAAASFRNPIENAIKLADAVGVVPGFVLQGVIIAVSISSETWYYVKVQNEKQIVLQKYKLFESELLSNKTDTVLISWLLSTNKSKHLFQVSRLQALLNCQQTKNLKNIGTTLQSHDVIIVKVLMLPTSRVNFYREEWSRSRFTYLFQIMVTDL